MKLNDKVENSGITLVALVITVIILLILASIALGMITGQNGLFARANQARDDYNKSAYAESVAFNGLQDYLAQYDSEGSGTNNHQEEVIYDETQVALHYDGLAEVDEVIPDLFLYNVNQQTNKCTVTGINYEYFIPGYNTHTEDAGSWLKGEEYTEILRKLVIPYRVSIDGTAYDVTGVNLSEYDAYFSWRTAGNYVEQTYDTPDEVIEWKEEYYPSNYVLPSLASGSNYESLSTSRESYLILPDTVETLYCTFPRDYILYPETNSLNDVTICGNCWLREFAIPSGVTRIGYYDLSTCCLLDKIFIPSSVTNIEARSLTGSGAPHIVENTTIYYEGSESEWNELVGSKKLTRKTGNDESIEVLYNQSLQDFSNNY